VTTFQEFALLHIENPSRPEAESQSRSVPISKAFASLSSTTTGRTVPVEAVSQRQAENAESKLFEASDLTAFFVEALAEGNRPGYAGNFCSVLCKIHTTKSSRVWSGQKGPKVQPVLC